MLQASQTGRWIPAGELAPQRSRRGGRHGGTDQAGSRRLADDSPRRVDLGGLALARSLLGSGLALSSPLAVSVFGASQAARSFAGSSTTFGGSPACPSCPAFAWRPAWRRSPPAPGHGRAASRQAFRRAAATLLMVGLRPRAASRPPAWRPLRRPFAWADPCLEALIGGAIGNRKPASTLAMSLLVV